MQHVDASNQFVIMNSMPTTAVIDCHSHILPGIDDGAKDPAMALAMARVAAGAGTQRMICTPHHLNGVFGNSRQTILKAVAQLRERLAEADIPLMLNPGSELHLVPELPAQLLDGTALTYNDRGKAALVELPKTTVPVGTDTILEQLLYRGITPVIAHPERNGELVRHPNRVGEWVDWGCKLQLTAQSCSGDFGERRQTLCRRWSERGWVHLIASDAHRPEGRSPDTLFAGRAAIADWLGETTAELLTVDNPQKLLDGENLLAPEPLRVEADKPRRWWFGFKVKGER